MTTPVRSTDRVRDVIARDLRLIDLFVSFSPHFERLRNPVMRRVVAGVVTIEQAAAIAGVPTATVLDALNGALGIASTAEPDTPDAAAAPQTAPTATRRRPSDRIVVELDVREDLRAGREPFSRIMSALRTVGDDLLRIRATFEPVPLVSVLSQRGLECETEEHAPDDWSLWAWHGSPAPVVAADTAEPAELPPPCDGAARSDEMWLDVRGLEPPEPMARTLVALETLPAGVTLVQVNVRVPQFLLPVLDERGFTYEIEDGHADRVLVRIRRAS